MDREWIIEEFASNIAYENNAIYATTRSYLEFVV